MKLLSFALIAALGVGLASCAVIIEGTSQDIKVVTSPGDATCVFEREGQTIGTIPSTPGLLTVRKSKYDITIKCNKPGFHEALYLNHSGTTATIAANIVVDLILTAGISSIVDSATGADNKYDPVVNIALVPIDQRPPSVP